MPRDLWAKPSTEARQNFDTWASPFPTTKPATLKPLTKPREWPLLPSQATTRAKARGMAVSVVSAEPKTSEAVAQFCTLAGRSETVMDKQRKLRLKQLRPLPSIGE